MKSGNGCYVCGSNGHWAYACPRRRCFACGRQGHAKAECPHVSDAEKQKMRRNRMKRKRLATSKLEVATKEEQWAMANPLSHKKWRQAIDTNGYIRLFRLGGKLEDHFKGVRCFNCMKHGHVAKDCPRRVCKSCLKPGHNWSTCPLTICSYCNRPGHILKNCDIFKNSKLLSKARKKSMLERMNPTRSKSKAKYADVVAKYLKTDKINVKKSKKLFKYTAGTKL